MSPDTDNTIPRINLLSAERPRPPRIVEQDGNPSITSLLAANMTLDQLKLHYGNILGARAVYYPVAFRFTRELGRGRQGVVFLGLRQGARGCVTEHAIKVYDPGIYRTPEEYWTDMGRIASQVSRLQRVQSPYLASSHSYEETYGIGYIQMEAIDGIDLLHLLTQKHLPLAREKSTPEEWDKFTATVFNVQGDRTVLQPGIAIYIVRRVLRGLERLHAMGFLHFDVKPANIMIDRLGSVKIVDFGRALTVGEKASFLLGSPLYMAPEVHRREPCTPRADIYALGLVALEMMTGVKLSEDDAVTEQDLLRMKLDLPARLPKMLPPAVHRNNELVSILLKMLQPDPAKRFEDAKQADSGPDGFLVVDRQLVHAGLDSEYSRDLSDYIGKLVDIRADRVLVSGTTSSDGLHSSG